MSGRGVRERINVGAPILRPILDIEHPLHDFIGDRVEVEFEFGEAKLRVVVALSSEQSMELSIEVINDQTLLRAHPHNEIALLLQPLKVVILLLIGFARSGAEVLGLVGVDNVFATRPSMEIWAILSLTAFVAEPFLAISLIAVLCGEAFLEAPLNGALGRSRRQIFYE